MLNLFRRWLTQILLVYIFFVLVVRAQQLDGAPEQILILWLNVVGLHDSVDFDNHFPQYLFLRQVGGESLLLFNNRIIFVFYGMLASPIFEYLNQNGPLLPFLLHLLEHYQILPQCPLRFTFTGIQMIQPSLSALFRCAKELFIGSDEQGLCYFIPLCIFIFHYYTVEHIVLLFTPLGHFN